MTIRIGLGIGLETSAGALNPYDFASPYFDRSLLTSATTTLGTEFDTAGLLRYAPHNMILQSQTFDNASWSKSNSTVSANALAAPDGTLTADKLVETATTAGHAVLQSTTLVATLDYVVSFYAKQGERPRTTIYEGSSTGARVTFDLSDGTIANTAGGGSPSGTIEDVGDGWYRCSMKFTSGKTGTNNFLQYILRAGDTGTTSYAGDGTSGIYVWGAQLEQNPSVSSYVATTSAVAYGPRKHVVYDGTSWLDKGLLVEGAATNLFTHSDQFDNAGWTKVNSTIDPDAVVGLDGSLTGDEMSATGASTAIVRRGVSAASGQTYMVSHRVRYRNNRWVSLIAFSTPFSTTPTVYFDLVGGVKGTSSGTVADYDISPLGDDEYLIWVKLVADGTATANFDFRMANGDGVGGTQTAGQKVDLLGAQVEASAFLTSYIPTVASAVTRSADKISIATSSINGWDDEVGGFIVSVTDVSGGTDARVIGGEAAETILNLASGGNINTYNASSSLQLTSPSINVGDGAAHEVSVSGNTVGRWITADNSAAKRDYNTFINTDIVDLHLGSYGGTQNFLFGAIKQLQYQNTLLPFAVVDTGAFVSTWTTTTSDQVVTLPLISGGTYSFTVDWGDGNSDTITAWNQTEKAHTYAGAASTYTIIITGTCVGWQFNNGGDKTVIATISQWGGLDISTSSAFYGCTNLNVIATDAPTVSSESLQFTFRDCTSLTTPNLNSWDMSGVTNMVGMFQSATSFNGTVAGWDTGSVATTQNMFIHAAAFNQAIGVWDMSSNAHVGGMFYNAGAAAFDQNVGGWNIGQVANGTNFMGGNSMSTANYSALLIGWQGQTHQSSVVFKGGGSTYSAGAATTARAALVTDGWTITDGGAA